MPVRCVDYELGNNSNSGKGWWRLPFTNGGTYEPQIDDQIVGETSGATAYIMLIEVSSGSWSNKTATGTFYLYGKNGTFQSETLSINNNSNTANISGDAPYDAKQTVANVVSGGYFDIYVAKTQDVRNTGLTATFTHNSGTITLNQSINQVILEPENTTGWTSAQGSNVTFSTDGNYRVDSASIRINIAAAATTGKVAYYTFSSPQDFSNFQTINFWVYSSQLISSANAFRLCLCADTIGNVIVNTVTFGNLASTTWCKISVDVGESLGSSIQSIAIYMDIDFTVNINIDGIFASKAKTDVDYIGLDTLISKNSTDNTGAECWYGIRYAVGNSILLDNYSLGTPYILYRGDTGSAALYARNMTRHPSYASIATSIIESFGSQGANIYGGWDKMTNQQSGYTWLYSNGAGQIYYNNTGANNVYYMNRIGISDANMAFRFATRVELREVSVNSCYYGIYIINPVIAKLSLDYLVATYDYALKVDSDNINVVMIDGIKRMIQCARYLNTSCIAINNVCILLIKNAIIEYGPTANSNHYFMVFGNIQVIILNNVKVIKEIGNNDLIYTGNCNLLMSNSEITNNTSAVSIRITNYGVARLFNTLINGSSTTEFGTLYFYNLYPFVYSYKHDKTEGNNIILWLNGTTQLCRAEQQSSGAWRISPKSTLLTSDRSAKLEIGRIYLTAGSHTIKLTATRSNAAVYGRLRILQNPMLGLNEDVIAETSGQAGNPEELTCNVSLSSAGIVQVEFEAWGGTSYYIDIKDLIAS